MRNRSLILAGLLTLVALAILISLGNWQLARLAWKNDIVARVAARVNEPPVPPPQPATWKSLDLADWEYRSVEVSGRFRNDLEAHVYTLLTEPKGPLGGPGYWVLTPLEVEGGAGTIIVNRGFVPLEPKNPATRVGSQLDGPVNVRGLLRAPEDRNLFTPNDEPEKRLFYARDPEPIGKALGITNVAAFTLDALESGPDGLPQGGETRLSFPNRHLEYALTWFGLAAALGAVFLAFAWGRLRGGRRGA